MPELKLSNRAVPALNVSSLVVGVGKDGDEVRVEGSGLPAALKHDIKTHAASLGLTGELGQIMRVPAGPDLKADTIVLTGLGKRTDDHYPAENLRQATGAALRSLAGAKSAAIVLPTPDQDALGAIVEGALLGNYAFTKYRGSSAGEHLNPVPLLEIATRLARSSWAQDAAARAEVTANAVNLARDLVNTLPNDLHPGTFSERVRNEVKNSGLRTVKVSELDYKQLVAGGYGGLVGVGRGSDQKPRLVKVAYTPATRTSAPKVGLVGKGITFDTGGISLKRGKDMRFMTSDMAGAASVFATVLAAARLELPIPVTAYLCLAENMPGGDATRPGDVLTMRNGKTVEVTNTDSEGRLVMGDGMTAAIEDGCQILVDIATLTNSQMFALGNRTMAIFGNGEIRDDLVDSTEAAGESAWPMPILDELQDEMASHIADFMNSPQSFIASVAFAAAFLNEFTGGVPWGHLDIAGPGDNRNPAYGYTPKGGTGFGVRTLVEFLTREADTVSQ